MDCTERRSEQVDKVLNQLPELVDAEEIARFDRLAATWWDAAGPMWPLHRLNALRVPFVVESVSQHVQRSNNKPSLSGLSVLDIGCGAGLLSEAMAKAGARVTGVDAAPRNIHIAREHAESGGVDIEYLCGSLEQVRDRRFDVVLNMEVVEHVADVRAFVRECSQCVSEGGMQLVATINRNPKSWLFAIAGAEYILRWLPRGTHQWHKFVKPQELERLLDEAGLTVVRRAGVGINPLTRSYRVTDDLSVNYMLVALRHG